jgi:hypothetical protein
MRADPKPDKFRSEIEGQGSMTKADPRGINVCANLLKL